MTSILFLCTANQIRSPFAAAYFKQLLQHTSYNNWLVDSAGTWATPGLPVGSSLRQLSSNWATKLQ